MAHTCTATQLNDAATQGFNVSENLRLGLTMADMLVIANAFASSDPGNDTQIVADLAV